MPGFQLSPGASTIDLVNDTIESFEILQIDTEAAVNDINYILGDNPFEQSLFGLINFAGVRGPSGSDPSIIVSDIDEISEATVEPSIEVGEPIIIQAEDLDLDTYRVETLNSGIEVISLLDASDITGTASLNVDDFSIAPDRYDLTLSVFDENDGQAQLEVLVNNNVVGDILLNEEGTASGFPTEATRRDIVIENIDINPGDVVAIRGTRDGFEQARVDFLNFSPSLAEDDMASALSISQPDFL